MANVIAGVVVLAIAALVGRVLYKTWHRNSLDEIEK